MKGRQTPKNVLLCVHPTLNPGDAPVYCGYCMSKKSYPSLYSNILWTKNCWTPRYYACIKLPIKYLQKSMYYMLFRLDL